MSVVGGNLWDAIEENEDEDAKNWQETSSKAESSKTKFFPDLTLD